MPRASINVEVEDGDLRKFIEDIARRWTLNTIHDLLKHIRDPHLSSLIKEALRTGLAAGRTVGRRRRPQAEYEEAVDSSFVEGAPPGPHSPYWGPPPPWGPGAPPYGPPYQRPFPGAPPPGAPPMRPSPGAPGFVDEVLDRMAPDVPPGAPHELRHCMPVAANQYQEEGWLCHQCGFVNGSHRSVCRHCKHERCDDIVASEGGGPS